MSNKEKKLQELKKAEQAAKKAGNEALAKAIKKKMEGFTKPIRK